MGNKQDDDCLGCRLASGGGLFLAAIYIYRQSLNQKTKFNRNGMFLISAGIFFKFQRAHKHVKNCLLKNFFILIAFGLTSAARLFNFFPFDRQRQPEKSQ